MRLNFLKKCVCVGGGGVGNLATFYGIVFVVVLAYCTSNLIRPFS